MVPPSIPMPLTGLDLKFLYVLGLLDRGSEVFVIAERGTKTLQLNVMTMRS